jgi:hypothetical protein
MTNIELSQDVIDPVSEPVDEAEELKRGLQLLEEYLASHPDAPPLYARVYKRESDRLAAMTDPDKDTIAIQHDPRHVGSGVTQLLFQ